MRTSRRPDSIVDWIFLGFTSSRLTPHASRLTPHVSRLHVTFREHALSRPQAWKREVWNWTPVKTVCKIHRSIIDSRVRSEACRFRLENMKPGKPNEFISLKEGHVGWEVERWQQLDWRKILAIVFFLRTVRACLKLIDYITLQSPARFSSVSTDYGRHIVVHLAYTSSVSINRCRFWRYVQHWGILALPYLNSRSMLAMPN